MCLLKYDSDHTQITTIILSSIILRTKYLATQLGEKDRNGEAKEGHRNRVNNFYLTVKIYQDKSDWNENQSTYLLTYLVVENMNERSIHFHTYSQYFETQTDQFKKWASFSFIFVFSNTHYNFYNKQVCEKCPSNKRCRDLNS